MARIRGSMNQWQSGNATKTGSGGAREVAKLDPASPANVTFKVRSAPKQVPGGWTQSK